MDCVRLRFDLDFQNKFLWKKRKKKINIKKSCDENLPKNSSQDYCLKIIKKASEGLYYISETDAEIFPFVGRKARGSFTGRNLKTNQKQERFKCRRKRFRMNFLSV